jgi:hypothetical protein
MKGNIAVLVLIFLAGLVLCAGCTSPVQNSDTRSVSGGAQAPQSQSGNFATPSPVHATGIPDFAGGSYGEQTAGADQKNIKTGQIALEVQNVTTSLEIVQDTAKSAGGYVGSMNAERDSADRVTATVTIRVPAPKFDETISSLKLLGKVKSQSEQAQDVTEEYTDLNARRDSLGNQLTQYNRIMQQANNVSDILRIQTEIDRVQLEIDRIDGRLKYLDNRIGYSTITIVLQEPGSVGPASEISPISVINEAISGFLTVLSALVIVIISLVPVIILVAVVYIVYRRRKERQKQEK